MWTINNYTLIVIVDHIDMGFARSVSLQNQGGKESSKDIAHQEGNGIIIGRLLTMSVTRQACLSWIRKDVRV